MQCQGKTKCRSVPGSKSKKLSVGGPNKYWIQKLVKPLIRPVRIIQFLVVLLIFALVIYTTAVANANVSSVTCILLTVLSAVYVLVLAIDIMSQLSGGELQSIPMFIFSLLGMIFFGIAGVLLISVYSATTLWYILTVLCLSLLMCILFVIDVVTVLIFWRRNCDLCKERYCANQTEILFQRSGICQPPGCIETVKYDLMTSVSSIKVPSGDEEAVADHSYRKIGYGRRRQYVDRPTNARSVAILEVADIQTEPSTMCSIQCQTQREIKEMPVQTVSKCELCNRQIPMFSTAMEPMQHAVQQTPCTTCPALMQLIRGAPCCPGCRCVTGIIQVSQQGKQQQTQRQEQSMEQKPSKESRQWQKTKDEKSYEIVTSDQEDPEMKGRPGTITKLTLASYSVTPNRTTDSSCQTMAAKSIKCGKKTPESMNAKKVKADVEKREKEQVKEVPKKLDETLIPEKEKSKTTISPAKKIPKCPSKRPSELTKTKSLEQEKKSSETVSRTPRVSLREYPDIITNISDQLSNTPQEQPLQEIISELKSEEMTLKTIIKECEQPKNSLALPDTKHLISPPRLVAEMIDRLQEIEGNKPDFLAVPETTKEKVSKLNTGMDIAVGAEQTTTSPTNVDGKSTNDEITHKPTLKSEDSAMDSSLITLESSKQLWTVQKVSNERFTHHKKSDKDRPKCAAKRRAKERVERSSDSILISNPHMGTQTSEADKPTVSNRFKRTYVFQKKNKIEPADVTHTDTDVQTGCEAQSENSATECKQTFPIKTDVCSACKRVQQVSTTSSSFHYYSVYRDKRGRFYCEFCATPNSIKVLHKNDNEHKRLKCAGCRNFIRTKHRQDLQDEIGFRNTLDNCPKCGQTQMQAASTSSN